MKKMYFIVFIYYFCCYSQFFICRVFELMSMAIHFDSKVFSLHFWSYLIGTSRNCCKARTALRERGSWDVIRPKSNSRRLWGLQTHIGFFLATRSYISFWVFLIQSKVPIFRKPIWVNNICKYTVISRHSILSNRIFFKSSMNRSANNGV